LRTDTQIDGLQCR